MWGGRGGGLWAWVQVSLTLCSPGRACEGVAVCIRAESHDTASTLAQKVRFTRVLVRMQCVHGTLMSECTSARSSKERA